MGAAQIPSSFVVTNSTDCTAANSVPRLYSLQGGLGATWSWVKLPPGASLSVEWITHSEVNPMGTAANPYQASALTKVCLPDQSQINKVVAAQSSYSQLTKSSVEVSGKVDPLNWVTSAKGAISAIEMNVNGAFDVAKHAYPLAVGAAKLYDFTNAILQRHVRRNPMIGGPQPS